MSDAPPPHPDAARKRNEALGWLAVLGVAAAGWALTRPALPTTKTGPGPGPQAPAGTPAKASLGVKLLGKGGELRVEEVYAGGNAERAGLRAGDVILKVDGSLAAEPRVVTDRLAVLAPGQALSLEVRRADGRVEVVSVSFAGEALFEPALARKLIAAGVDQLLAARLEGGAWPHYQEATRPSVAVTALAASTLARVGEADLSAAAKAVLEDARALLVRAQAEDGGLTDPAEGLYPHRTYATALAALALEGQTDPARVAARDRMLRWLCAAQVGEAHGYDAIDSRYGGWSYYDTYVGARLRTDVSTLRFATLALAGRAPDGTPELKDDAPTWDRARLWLDLCQNRTVASAPDAPAHAAERALRDGGFAFGPRASKALSEPVGDLVVFRSYGSATADGALALCCVDGIDARKEKTAPALRPELTAAVGWLAERWDLAGVPGFRDDAEGWTQGVHFYYLASLAELLHRVGAWRVVGSDGQAHPWAPELVRLLGTLHEGADKDRKGKRFVNASGLMHEDEPTIAASFAVLALCAARDRMALDGGGDVSATRTAAAAASRAGPALERGRVIYQRCEGCHQQDGLGNGPALTGLSDRLRARWPDEGKAAGALRAFLLEPSKAPLLEDRPGVVMPPQALAPGELDDVIQLLLSR